MAFNTKETELIKWGVTNGKSKEEITQALTNLRTGIVPKVKEVEKLSTFDRIKTGIQEKGEKIQEQIAGEGELADKSALERGIGATATGFSALSGTLYNALPEGARNTLDKVGGGIGKGMNYLADKISNNPALQEFANSEAGKDTERVARVLVDLGIISGEILGADQATKALSKGAGLVEQGAVKAKDLTAKGGDLAKEQIKKVLPKSEDIMTKVARITPKEAQTFQKITGKSTGEYLSQKGNFNAPEDLIKVEAETFAKTLADKESTLARLPGEFKSGIVDDVLESLKNKALETSSKNVKAPYLKQVNEWLKKAKTTGLTMEEINQAKKLFEREVKLGYNTLTDATKVKQATYLDDALRDFQDKTASSLGFTNIKDLSKQIQASKFIVDKLGNKIVSNDLLNGVSLTDYIILAGGEPTSVGAFLTKKLFSSKKLQAKLAEKLYKGEVKAPVKSDYSFQATKAIQPKNSIKNPMPKSSPKSPTKSIDEEMVTVYHASPKMPKTGNWRKDTYFASTADEANYYASSHHNGKIDIQKVEIPKRLLHKNNTNNIYQLKEEYPIKTSATKSNLGQGETPKTREITPDFNLTGQDAKIQNASISKYKANAPKLVQEYLKSNGKIVNTDEARKLFKDVGYKGSNAAAVQEASSAVAKDVWEELLRSSNKSESLILAGGSGTGKTSAVKNLLARELEDAGAVLDGNLSTMKSAQARIQESVNNGKFPTIGYVYRDPVDSWINGVIKRMKGNVEEGGRVVPLSVFLENHAGSYNVIKELLKDSANGVKYSVKLIDNSLGKGNQSLLSRAKFDNIKYSGNLKEELLAKTKQLYEKGDINKTEYEALIK